jgi:DNA adenine methylase
MQQQFRNGFHGANGVTKLPVFLPLKTHGGKGAHNGKLAKWIISLMPAHQVYCEPFAGGLAVLLHKDPNGVSEVVNDLNGGLTNCVRVLQADAAGLLRLLPRNIVEADWRDALARLNHPDPVVRAAAYLIRNRLSMSGRGDCFTPLTKTRIRGGMNAEVSAWQSFIDAVPAIQKRLERVVIVGPMDGLEFIRRYDSPDTWFMNDPPYLPETRTCPHVYPCEMSVEQHNALLICLSSIQGKFLLCGYRSELYDTFAQTHGWQRHDFDTALHAAKAKKKRRTTESIWINF